MQAGGEVWRGTMGDAIVAVKKISESYRELKADVGTFGIVSVHEDLEREVVALTEMCVSVGASCWLAVLSVLGHSPVPRAFRCLAQTGC